MPEPSGAAERSSRSAGTSRRRQRGQVLAIFAAAIVLFVGILAIVVDVSWYWSSSLRVQRAADAASLAGVVWLPGDVTRGVAAADAAAAQNGYPTTQVGISISANQDSQVRTGGNPNQMDVTISAPVSTFFMRLFGITKIQATRTSHAVYVLPVPMGSPLNYYGDFGLVRHPGGGTTQDGPGHTLGPNSPTAPTASQFGGWTNPQNAFASEKPTPKYAAVTERSSSNTQQSWTKFNLTGLPSGAVIDGLQVNVIVNATRPGCNVSADLSWNGGGSWTNANESISGIPTTDTVAQFGGATDDWMQGNQTHTWTANDLSNNNFVVRLSDDGGNNCDLTSGSRNHTISLDLLQVVVYYHGTTFVPDSNLAGPNGESLSAQGFWGTMMSEGGISLNGDAYMPRYDTRTSPANPLYDSATYYNYDIETQPGAPDAQLYIYDPEFCASEGTGQYGTGDRWLGGAPAAMSAFYDVYDTKLTQDTSDDSLLYSSRTAGLFQPTKPLADPNLFDPGDLPNGTTDCSSDPAHLNWWHVPVTLQGGHLYRLHTYSTDPSNKNAQNNVDGHNSFSIWAGWPGAGGSSLLPRVYGVGAMETFEPLAGGGAEIFYLAQIGAEHAGKTMEINLWDPGDTGVLPASLRILQPTVTGYTPVTFSWTAKKGNTNGQSCNSLGKSGVTSVATNVGDPGNGRNATTGIFNGCWLTIVIPLPIGYTAPQPPTETHGGGWWKIEYDMGGKSTFAPAFDLTTWQVDLLGNPVHLIVP